ncbi:Alpha/Beta hydrolase protein [Aspergillus pseudocaelatus]|uniref:Alpha/Beta hydrolase protein n=1 Tax=Aspergillus pseudocaelatus TaxID=1825620 RepID=A0ABQ6WVD7_9EURO|nr:Alpha/Beta hydrolase protein [Aspergillus pseudocaelatus]
MPAPSSFKPEGRIGDATLSPRTDSRFNPKLVKALATQGWDNNLPIGIADENSPFDQLTREMRSQHYGFSEGFAALPNDLPQDANEPPVDRETLVAKGVDGNDVKLYVFRKSGTQGQVLPCVVYIHGGGMTTLDTLRPGNIRWLTDLAQRGVVSIAIDFRNAWSEHEYNPFPAGLNDCAEGVKYIASHKDELGVSSIILEGESGGANLCLATALKANQEGWVKDISGVYAYSPNVCNVYGWSAERIASEFPSRLANDGYMLDTTGAGAMQSYYAPNVQDRTNPLAFPYYATIEMCQGLPPHIIKVDELDPLRDEGIAYYRKLCTAGVDAIASVNLGVTHGSMVLFRRALSELHSAGMREIVGFAKSL